MLSRHVKTLYLVRHAKSSWEDPELTDHQRPLSKRGIRDVPHMGEVLKKRNVYPQLLMSSTAVRSRLTSESLARHLSYPREQIQFYDKLYFKGIRPMMELLLSQPDKLKTIMLVGHNPDLTDLHNSLCPQLIDNIPTTGIVELHFYIQHWSELETKAGKRGFFEYPRLYFPKKTEKPTEFGN